ncbi:M1 family aminopeptidase [Arthrobacter sp. NPDC089319]|uniref:M1 family aminopeptidase n=1 Tax=Arthrobacter sp. NPDC089319 TaxID=3155915 RepID=UPI003425DB87
MSQRFKPPTLFSAGPVELRWLMGGHRMLIRRGFALAAAAVLGLSGLSLTAEPAAAAPDPGQHFYEPGATTLHDTYFPDAGNGGYQATRYLLDLVYDPPTDQLNGKATITAQAKQDLSEFSLDLDGLAVQSVSVNGLGARFDQAGTKLGVAPARGVPKGRTFTVEVEYSGVPHTLALPGPAGFIHTGDGALVTGHPASAPTWFPVNNHPSDPASYTFNVSVPDGWQAVANGLPDGTSRTPGRTVYKWTAQEPLSPHLATIAVGHFDLAKYSKRGISYVDAMDPALKKTVIPRNGDGLAWSQSDDASYKRLTRTVSVPDADAEFSFWMLRDTEPGWDYAFVEARTPGKDNWTTLKDATGFAENGTGNSCPAWHQVHPFLKHYQNDDGGGSCSAKGSTGQWWAATGTSDGWEHWEFDLADYAGEDVELSITYASDITGQNDGVFVEDIKVTGSDGSTSFDSDGDRWDGWSPQGGAPKGSRPNENEWTAGSSTPPSQGYKIQQSLDKQPKMIKFLSSVFGAYPLASAGGIVDNVEDLGFVLEAQARPVYPMDYFYSEASGDSFIVRQLALQWLGSQLPVHRWQDSWLNQGLATYAQWLWAEDREPGSAQDSFEFYADIDAADPFWKFKLSDPGPDNLFSSGLQTRAAMALHAVRTEIGDKDFHKLVRQWVKDGSGSPKDFRKLAEDISGKDLGPLFKKFVATAGKPGVL